MNSEIKEDLLRVGEEIADYRNSAICDVIGREWQDTKEAKMLNPGEVFWWGRATMNEPYYSLECRNARLLGIAMMVTMPKEILDHKCCKRKKLKK